MSDLKKDVCFTRSFVFLFVVVMIITVALFSAASLASPSNIVMNCSYGGDVALNCVDDFSQKHTEFLRNPSDIKMLRLFPETIRRLKVILGLVQAWQFFHRDSTQFPSLSWIDRVLSQQGESWRLTPPPPGWPADCAPNAIYMENSDANALYDIVNIPEGSSPIVICSKNSNFRAGRDFNHVRSFGEADDPDALPTIPPVLPPPSPAPPASQPGK